MGLNDVVVHNREMAQSRGHQAKDDVKADASRADYKYALSSQVGLPSLSPSAYGADLPAGSRRGWAKIIVPRGLEPVGNHSHVDGVGAIDVSTDS